MEFYTGARPGCAGGQIWEGQYLYKRMVNVKVQIIPGWDYLKEELYQWPDPESAKPGTATEG